MAQDPSQPFAGPALLQASPMKSPITLSIAGRHRTLRAPHKRPHPGQRGFTLVELLVGITIGLLTIAVALGAIVASRGVSGTVSDASQLQQQAAYAFRVMSKQLRQAGSLRLNLAPQKPDAGAVIDPVEAVAFETKATGSDSTTFDPFVDTLSGIDNPTSSQYKLTVGYRNYTETVTTGTDSLLRDCLGGQTANALIQSRFVLNTTTNELQCAGLGAAQPIIQNVANFQVRYMVQTDPAPFGNPQIQYRTATQVGAGNWASVFGVEVCLVVYGTERIDMPAGSTYRDCDGTTNVDMTTLASPRTRRMHMTFRNVYMLRSQGLVG
jgi:type IV pilus assembly protein PilW